MRENKSDPNRWSAEHSEMESLPKFGEGLPPSRTAFEELRKYPFFFANEDADGSDNEPQAGAATSRMERSATLPPLPTPSAEIRPLVAQRAPDEARPDAAEETAKKKSDAAAALAARHAAAVARRQGGPSASPIPVAPSTPVAPPTPIREDTEEPVRIEEDARIEDEAPIARSSRVAPIATAGLDDEPDLPTPTQRPPRVHPAVLAISQSTAEPWYSRVPTGASLVAVIAYFLIGGIALIVTGLVLGGFGGVLMALFGLAVTSVAAFAAWQELTAAKR